MSLTILSRTCLLLSVLLVTGTSFAVLPKHPQPARTKMQPHARASAEHHGRSISGGGHIVAAGKGRAATHPLPTRTAKGRYGSRQRAVSQPAIDPGARLDTVSELSYSLAHSSGALTHTAALSGFYEALAAHQGDPTAGTIRVLQFGDSHTAADMFTGEARRVFQSQFGNGGIGFSYPGHPFAGYRIYGSQRSQTMGWKTLGTHFLDLGDAELGLGGVALSTYSPGQSIMLDTPCSSFALQFLRQPGGGTVQVTDNGVNIGEVDTSGETAAGDSFDYDCPAASVSENHHFVVTTESSAPVRLLGTTTLQPGVTWEAMGINGAQAPLILDWNQPIFTSFLAKTAASLIVLAYGTNEAAASHWTVENYSETFGRLVDTLHRTLPSAAILVLGPSDRDIAVRRRGFAPFTGTGRIIEAQREVCRTHNCAFWDTQQRMGGFGSMRRWVYAGWAQHDHTHFNAEGYRVLADALMADLLSGYDNYRAAHGLSVAPTLHGSPSAVAPVTPTPDALP